MMHQNYRKIQSVYINKRLVWIFIFALLMMGVAPGKVAAEDVYQTHEAKVQNEAGQGVYPATVCQKRLGYDGQTFQIQKEYTTSTGGWVTLNAGTMPKEQEWWYELEVSATGYNTWTGTLRFRWDDNLKIVTLSSKTPPQPTQANTSLTVQVSPTSIPPGGGARVTISGRLIRTDTGVGVAEKSITLNLPGVYTYARTDPAGNYSYSYNTPNLVVGSHPVEARFDGDSSFGSSQAQTTLTVGLGDTSVSILLEPSTANSGIPTEVRITGQLVDSNTRAGIPNRQVELQWPVGKTNVTTTSNGSFSHTLTVNTNEKGWVFEATFWGDNSYNKSWDRKTLQVITQPQPEPDFDLIVYPSTISLPAGQSASYIEISVQPAKGIDATRWCADLSLSGLQTNVGNYFFNPRCVTASWPSTLTISILTDAPSGSYELNIRASANGITKMQILTLNVIPGGDSTQNYPPIIKNVVFDPPLEAGGVIAGSKLKVTIEASDPNGDKLAYKTYIWGQGFNDFAFFENHFFWEVPDLNNAPCQISINVSDNEHNVQKLLEFTIVKKGGVPFFYRTYKLDYNSLPTPIGKDWIKGSRTIFGATRIDLSPGFKYSAHAGYLIKDTFSLLSFVISMACMHTALATGSNAEMAKEVTKVLTTEAVEYTQGEITAKAYAAALSAIELIPILTSPIPDPLKIPAAAIKIGDSLLSYMYEDLDKLMEEGWDVLKQPGLDELTKPHNIILVYINDMTGKEQIGSELTTIYENGYKFYYLDQNTKAWKLWKNNCIKIELIGTSSETKQPDTNTITTSTIFNLVDDYFDNHPSDLTDSKVPTKEDVFNYLDHYFKKQ
jgi:hypothetical protein